MDEAGMMGSSFFSSVAPVIAATCLSFSLLRIIPSSGVRPT